MAVPKPRPSLSLDFDEALAYFRSRRAVTGEEWAKLDADARQRAVRVASIAHRGMLNDVWQALEKSVADGTDFRQFKAEIAATLRKKYGADSGVPAHLDTIYRNEVQRSFTHGRVVAALDPDVRRARPFWQFRAIEDNRITPVCKECNGTIAEAAGEWWRSHLPPLHHRCRSSFVPLTVTEAGRRGGVTGTPPAASGTSGFGRMPEPGDAEQLEAAKSAKLPRELQPKGDPAIPEGPPGHPGRPGPPPTGGGGGDGPEEPRRPPWWTQEEPATSPGSLAVEPGARPSPKEERIASELVEQGNHVVFLRPTNRGAGDRTADARVGRLSADTPVELKTLDPPLPGAAPQSDKTLIASVVTAAKRAWKGTGLQARCVVVDVRQRGVTEAQATAALLELRRNARKHFDFVRVIGVLFDLTIDGTP